ncbi:MAG: hypothetical protein PHU75_04380 [Candidatus Nanopelagicales bacterium]|nr:hypothetical protein [Candidatus Nanopelagicales bacterium]
MTTSDQFSSYAAIIALLLVGFAIVAVIGRRAMVLRACVAGYSLHIAVSAFLLYYYGVGAIGPDAGSYNALANQLADSISGQSSGLTYVEGKEGWLYVLAILYVTFGKAPEIGLIVIATLMGIVPAIMASASRMMGWEASARLAAWIAVLLPSLVIWPSSILREGPSIFLLSLMVLAVGMFHRNRPLPAGVLLILATATMMWIRPPIGIAAFLGIAIAVAFAPWRRTSGVMGTLIFLAPAALALPFGLVRGSSQFSLSAAGTLRENLAAGASTSTGATAEGWDTVGGALMSMVRDLPAASFGPLPWEMLRQPWQLAVDGVSFIVLAVFVVIALRSRITRSEAITLVLPAIAVLLVVAAAFGNYGFVVRQRSQAVPFIIPVAAAGFMLRRRGSLAKELPMPDATAARSHA